MAGIESSRFYEELLVRAETAEDELAELRANTLLQLGIKHVADGMEDGAIYCILGGLKQRLAELEESVRWRTSREEMPGTGEVEIRATGWYEEGLGWNIYLGGDLVDSFPASPGVQWRPIVMHATKENGEWQE